jgi:hypothetical protein
VRGTDLAHELPGFSIVPIKVRLRGFAGRTAAIFGNITIGSAFDRLDWFSVLPRVVKV